MTRCRFTHSCRYKGDGLVTADENYNNAVVGENAQYGDAIEAIKGQGSDNSPYVNYI
jgi:hypothetical protein